MKSVWITRTRPGADATAERVRALGHDAVTAPLLAVRAALQAVVDLTDVTLLAFTSANGVRAFADRSPCRELVVFAVGDVTAAAARAAGFTDVRSADGDVAALAKLIASASPRGAVLCPGAEDRAGDLVGELADAGIEARAVTLYRTVPTLGLAESDLAGVGAILIHSPRAASLLPALGLELSAAAVVGLSSACLEPLARTAVKRWAVAERPTEDALLAALCGALGISPARR